MSNGLRGLMRGIARHAIIRGYDIGVHIAEWPRVHFLRANNHLALIRTLEKANVKRLALVAPHPSALLEFSTRHLMHALVENGYTAVVLMSDPTTAKWLNDEFPQTHMALRKKKGRDFGAWKELILAIYQSKSLTNSIEKLILVNDSLFYNETAVELIHKLSAPDSPWACLYENFEHHYHAQSFLLEFNGDVVRSKAFRNFWAAYRPYSSRRHSIDNGEVRLSRVVSCAFGPPNCVLRSPRFVDKVLEANSDEIGRLLVTLNVNPHIVRTSGPVLQRVSQLLGDLPFANARFIQADEVPLAKIRDELAVLLGDIIETINPTHAVGILANNLWGVPIKRDLAVRAHYQTSDVLRTIKGYSVAEAKVIEKDLRAKKIAAPTKGIGRILFDAGRI